MTTSPVTKPSRLRRAVQILFPFLLAATVFFIFFNSSDIGSVSGGKSQWATTLLNRITGALGLGAPFTELAVRKLGHLAEYALLGFWLLLTLRVYTRRTLRYLAWPLFFGLLIAVLDEFYQLSVPGRDGNVRDVLIDLGGVVAGLCIAWLLCLLAGRLFRALRRQPPEEVPPGTPP